MYKLNQKGASSWDLVLKILSITLVSLFAFSSGVWFGKKLSDSDYQRLALEGEFDREVGKGQTASKESDPTDEAAHDAEALTEEEVAAATDKAIHGQKAAETGEQATAAAGHEAAPPAKAAQVASGHGASTDKHEAAAPAAHAPEKARTVASTTAAPAHGAAAPAHGTAAPASNVKPDLSAAHQAAARVASNAAPVAKEQPKAESRVPSSLPKTVGATNDVEFTVQVASYPTAEAAKEHVDSLVKKGFPAFPVEASINGKVWYRVSVGSFKSFNDASKYRAQLVKQTDLPSAIVSKISR